MKPWKNKCPAARVWQSRWNPDLDALCLLSFIWIKPKIPTSALLCHCFILRPSCLHHKMFRCFSECFWQNSSLLSSVHDFINQQQTSQSCSHWPVLKIVKSCEPFSPTNLICNGLNHCRGRMQISSQILFTEGQECYLSKSELFVSFPSVNDPDTTSDWTLPPLDSSGKED